MVTRTDTHPAAHIPLTDHDRAMNALYGDEEVQMRGGRWCLRRLTPEQIQRARDYDRKYPRAA